MKALRAWSTTATCWPTSSTFPRPVEVRAPFIGSGFGGKLWPWPHSVAARAAAKVTGRPVQLVLPRAQMFTTVGHRPETRQRLRLATDASGKLVSIRHESFNNTSMLDDYTENCGGVTKSLYACDNVLVSHKISPINRGTPTSMRAPGAAPGLFALESAIDEMALASGMDPLAFRKLNLSDKDQSAGLPWSSNHLPEAIDKAAERFGWHARKADVGSMREGDEIIGYGMGACNWEAYQVPTDARVILRSDGTALAQCGLQDIGTGTYTIVAQTVSQLTGIPMERVEVELGSSSFPAGPVSGGSWVTASVMPAIAGATREALQKLRQYAVSKDAVFAGQDAEAIKVENGQLVMGEQRASFVDVLNGQRLSRAEGTFQSGMPEAGKYSFRSFGVHFVEVRWDPGISSLRVSRVVSAIDVGKVVNPLAARNQVEGAIVMGIGMALFEAGEYDPRSGMPVNNNYAEYVVPVHADQPDIDVLLLDYPDYNLGEFGARGIGEIGVTGLAAAVANAVYHATGKRCAACRSARKTDGRVVTMKQLDLQVVQQARTGWPAARPSGCARFFPHSARPRAGRVRCWWRWAAASIAALCRVVAWKRTFSSASSRGSSSRSIRWFATATAVLRQRGPCRAAVCWMC